MPKYGIPPHPNSGIGISEAEKILVSMKTESPEVMVVKGSIFTMSPRFSGRFIHRRLWRQKVCRFFFFFNIGKTTRLLHSIQTSLGKFLALHVLKNGFSLCKKEKSTFVIHCTPALFGFFSLLYFKDCNTVNVGGKKPSYSKPSMKCI